MAQQSDHVPHMLVIDPDKTAADPIVAGMRALGWHVDYARTFQQALSLAPDYSYEFCVLELVLPDALASDIWEFIRKMNPNILGVITTSSPALFRSVNPRQPGIVSFLLKPFDLKTVSDAAAHLYEYQRLRADNNKIERKIIGLANLASSLSSLLIPTEALKLTLAHLSSIIQTEGVLLYLIDDKSMSWSMQMTSGILPSGSDRTGFLPFAERLMFEAIETLLPIVLDDGHVFDARYGITSLSQVDLKAIAVVPILAGGRGLGALALIKATGVRNRFSDLDVQLGVLASQIIGLALTNLQLIQQADDKLIYEVNSNIHSRAFLESLLRLQLAQHEMNANPISLVRLKVTGIPSHLASHEAVGTVRTLYVIAEWVQQQVRESDVVALRDQSEVAVLLYETDTAEASAIAERLAEIVGADLKRREPHLHPQVTATVVSLFELKNEIEVTKHDPRMLLKAEVYPSTR